MFEGKKYKVSDVFDKMVYQPPVVINTIYDDIATKIKEDTDTYICKTIRHMGIEVNKEELIKAINYDRGQYEKGFRDGVKACQKEWIMVDDALPEPFEVVYVTCKAKGHDNWIEEVCYTPQDEGNMYSGWNNLPLIRAGLAEVIAWAKKDIPEPYKD